MLGIIADTIVTVASWWGIGWSEQLHRVCFHDLYVSTRMVCIDDDRLHLNSIRWQLRWNAGPAERLARVCAFCAAIAQKPLVTRIRPMWRGDDKQNASKHGMTGHGEIALC